ncbi:MAG TPA: DUF4097 family beta strand repeat-containing protein [Pyrinomonadaceae bacterium]
MNRIAGLLLATALTTQLAAASISGAASSDGGSVASASVAPAVAVVAARPAPQDQGNEFRWTGRLASGRVIEVKGVNGRVNAEGTAAGGEVEVVATKRARQSDPASVRVEVVEHADGVTICAVYPNGDRNKQNRCVPGEGGNMSVQNNDVQVDFTVRVPAGVRFHGKTVNGGVEADNIAADVEAYTVNGGISVSTTGLVKAMTVNGSIRATMGRADWQGELQFATVNGGIDLIFPSTLSTEVEAETLNGHIETDFPITAQGRLSKRRLEGVINGGGRELRLKTVNGNVEIRRAS